MMSRPPAPPPHNPSPRPRRMFYMPFALIWAGLIVYGTLLPFELKPGITHGQPSWASYLIEIFTSPRWFVPDGQASKLGISAAASDLTVNLMLLLPLGLLLRLHLRQRRCSLLGQWLIPSLFALGLCWSIESVQSILVGRFGTIQDVLTNTAGAVVGVAMGPWIGRAFRTLTFAAYRKCSYRLHHAQQWLMSIRRSPLAMFIVTGINMFIIFGYFAAGPVLGEGTKAHALPFMGLFQRSYDVGAMYAGRAMIVYCLVGGLLSIQFMRLRSRKTISILILIMALLAFGSQLLEAGGTRTVDLTESFIAIMAGGFLLTTIYLLIHAVRCSCRRKTQVPIAVERRRVPFEYNTT